MNTNKKKKNGITIGTSLILVTFVLLCLVAFSVLSFASANADYTKSTQTAEHTKDYYAAVSIAETRIADLIESRETNPEALHFTVPINDTQNLSVTLQADATDDNEPVYTIIEYKTITTNNPQDTTTIREDGGLLF
ncbi:MAG: hypothetical protein Q4D54_04000 [Eubacteriales bacterium]|nr:hypothetical protein [Lachnospiraceae bacterium]MDO5126895.1 hypothetical protein [Eubacteriales bacterium]